jgi:hypothetical protein
MHENDAWPSDGIPVKPINKFKLNVKIMYIPVNISI